MIQRRKFLQGIFSAFAAPAIVRVGSIMPVKALPADINESTIEELVAWAHEYRFGMQFDWRGVFGTFPTS